MTRPTPEQIKESRRLLSEPVEQWNKAGRSGLPVLTQHDMEALENLLAATEPPTDEEIVARYKAFLERKGYEDRGHAIWFADGVEAFIGRKRYEGCACGKCPVKP